MRSMYDPPEPDWIDDKDEDIEDRNDDSAKYENQLDDDMEIEEDDTDSL